MTIEKDTPKKKQKKKGPLRLEAIIPILIVIILTGAYFTLLFDKNLRSGLEWAATKGNGAEVNIDYINTSFRNASITIGKIQVTDKDDPTKNLIEIDKIHFGLLWDALLRAKIVINDASIKGIKAFSLRKKPGRILPIEPKSAPPKEILEVKEKAIKQAESQFNENILGDLAAVAGGVDPDSQLNNMQAQLKAEKFVADLQMELKNKEKEWKSRFENLPSAEVFDGLVARAKKLKFDTKNPIQFAADLKELDKILKEGDSKIKEFNKASNDLKSDLNKFDKSINSIDDMVQQDINDLQKRLKIPNLNMGDFSKDLFGKILQDKLGKYQKYVDMAREYMPPPKSERSKEEEIPKPRARGIGLNIKFPVTTGYPLFWLKNASISSQATTDGFSGDLEGALKHLTSDPAYIKKPTTFTIKGDFPNQGIMGLNGIATFDHTTDKPKDTFRGIIAAFPINSHNLSNSNDVKLRVNKAMGSASMAGEFFNNEINFSVKNNFNQIDYTVEAKSKDVQEILDNVIKGLPVVNLEASAKGPFSHLKWKITSNLGKELSHGFKREVQKKIDEAKKKLEKFVNDKIAAEKTKLNKELVKVRGQIDSQLSSKKQELEKAQKQAQNQINSKKQANQNVAKKEEQEAKKKLEKEGKKLLKKLGL